MSKADNKELEEAMKILEDKECFWNNSEIKVLEAIKIVLKELERLQEEKQNIKDITEKVEEAIKRAEKEFIPKNKIREKIEERKTLLDTACRQKKIWNQKDYVRVSEIQILNELLNGK